MFGTGAGTIRGTERGSSVDAADPPTRPPDASTPPHHRTAERRAVQSVDALGGAFFSQFATSRPLSNSDQDQGAVPSIPGQTGGRYLIPWFAWDARPIWDDSL